MTVLDSSVNSKRARELFEFTQGIDVDRRLVSQEIRVQKAWAVALEEAHVLSQAELRQALDAYAAAEKACADGSFQWRIEDEDVHMNLERFLTERVGELGKKVHLGRSRNDLIATTLRLYVADQLTAGMALLREVGAALALQADRNIDLFVPGTTHLQAGQPVRAAHMLLAHAWPIVRDLKRLEVARERALEYMPLGSAALAGSGLKLDWENLAVTLGFSGCSDNAYEAVGDRDFVVDALDVIAMSGIHLSRLSEDFIHWSSTAVGLLNLPIAWSTGSSIMPNKRNPDVPELVRGKSAHLIGASSEAKILLKGLPTSYDSDLHEMKGIFHRSFDEWTACLSVLPPFIREMSFDEEVAASLCASGHLLATEITDYLATPGGIPFREAYRQVAALVAMADARKVQINELDLDAARQAAPALAPHYLKTLSFEQAIERRQGPGGTAKARVQDQLAALSRLF